MKSFFKFLGFTLAALFLLFAVVSLVLYPPQPGTRAESRDAKRKSDISNIQLSLDKYAQVYRKYPGTLNELIPTYLEADKIIDPSTKKQYNYQLMQDNGAEYKVCSQLEIKKEEFCVTFNLY